MTKRIFVDANVEYGSIEELIIVEIVMIEIAIVEIMMAEITLVETMMIEIVIEKENHRSKTRVTLYLYNRKQDFLFPVPVLVINVNYCRFNLS